MKSVKEIRQAIKSHPSRSAWVRGVKLYALDLLEELGDIDTLADDNLDRKTLLNGADSWEQYSYGGCSLIYNSDIAERLCSPSELKRCNGGDWRPNRREEWLDVQARALHQAERLIKRLIKEV